jgi:hypothetical protein
MSASLSVERVFRPLSRKGETGKEISEAQQSDALRAVADLIRPLLQSGLGLQCISTKQAILEIAKLMLLCPEKETVWEKAIERFNSEFEITGGPNPMTIEDLAQKSPEKENYSLQDSIFEELVCCGLRDELTYMNYDPKKNIWERAIESFKLKYENTVPKSEGAIGLDVLGGKDPSLWGTVFKLFFASLALPTTGGLTSYFLGDPSQSKKSDAPNIYISDLCIILRGLPLLMEANAQVLTILIQAISQFYLRERETPKLVKELAPDVQDLIQKDAEGIMKTLCVEVNLTKKPRQGGRRFFSGGNSSLEDIVKDSILRSSGAKSNSKLFNFFEQKKRVCVKEFCDGFITLSKKYGFPIVDCFNVIKIIYDEERYTNVIINVDTFKFGIITELLKDSTNEQQKELISHLSDGIHDEELKTALENVQKEIELPVLNSLYPKGEQTPLHIAASKGMKRTTEILFQHCNDDFLLQRYGEDQTFFDILVKNRGSRDNTLAVMKLLKETEKKACIPLLLLGFSGEAIEKSLVAFVSNQNEAAVLEDFLNEVTLTSELAYSLLKIATEKGKDDSLQVILKVIKQQENNSLIEIVTGKVQDRTELSIIEIAIKGGLQNTLNILLKELRSDSTFLKECEQIIRNLVNTTLDNIFNTFKKEDSLEYEEGISLEKNIQDNKESIKTKLAKIDSAKVLSGVLATLFPNGSNELAMEVLMGGDSLENSPVVARIKGNSSGRLNKMLDYVQFTPASAYALLKVAIESNRDNALKMLLDRMQKQNPPIFCLDVLKGNPIHKKPPLTHLTIVDGHSETLKVIIFRLKIEEQLEVFIQKRVDGKSLLQIVVETENIENIKSFLSVLGQLLISVRDHDSRIPNRMRNCINALGGQEPQADPLMPRLQEITTGIYELLRHNIPIFYADVLGGLSPELRRVIGSAP